MKRIFVASFALILSASACMPHRVSAASRPAASQEDHSLPGAWQSTKAEHVYGFPDAKPNSNGTLTLSADALTFSRKSGNTSIPRTSLTTVSAGNQRVELWGTGGRILRMAIPDGGGLAAATVMHHRIDMLTIGFLDDRGGNHSAVFFLPANEAERAVQSFALIPASSRKIPEVGCRNNPIEPTSVLVSTPNWDRAEVPAAYRALVYEHVIDRLRHAKGVKHVYRDGESNRESACSQYTIHISIATFKEGSSVQRAFMGPVGMFVGTTQMVFDVTYTDASGKLNVSEQIRATMRGDSESTNVADHVAKNLSRHYVNMLRNAGRSNSVKRTDSPVS
jgi:hypothetical protein